MAYKSGKDVEWVTIVSEKMPYGSSNFVEVARKKRLEGSREIEFISISKGYRLEDGSERFNKAIGFPDDPKIKQFISEKINQV